MMESRGRGVLDTSHARGMTVVELARRSPPPHLPREGWHGASAPRRRLLLRRLLSQLCYILRGELRSLAAEARGDGVGDRGDLDIGIGVAERGHRDSVLWRLPPGPGNHDLGDVGGAGIVDRPGTGQRGEG